MKSISVLAAAILIVATLVSVPLSAQQATTQALDNHIPRYRLIDLGTFGGPNSSETVEFPYINNTGMVVGFADTNIPDPFNPGGFIPHAFRWQNGVLADLGTLPGGHGGFAVWSNDRGQVVGLSDNGQIDPVLGGPQGRGVLWEHDGSIVDLGTLGGTQSLAADINQPGQIVGVAANEIADPFSIFGWSTQTRAALWQNDKLRDLGTLGGTDAATAMINDRGQIAGFSYTSSDPTSNCLPFGIPVPLATGAFLWERGKMVNLGGFGGTCTFAGAINNRGEIIGQSNLSGDEITHTFLWSHGVMDDLGTLGGTFSVATGLNDAGQIAGGATTANDDAFHAFFWRNGSMTDLGTVGNDTCSVAHFINANGKVVGTSGDCAGTFELHGFLSVRGGPMIDLNNFVPPGSDLQVTDGETINNRGEIAGSGMLPNGDFHAIVLVPCDDTGEDCLSARENLNAASNIAPRALSSGTLRPKLNAREILAAVHSRMARRYHSLSNGVGAHR
jgi:probable HAF family extracellular repeat protein